MIYNFILNMNRLNSKFIDNFHTISIYNSLNNNISGSATRLYQRESLLASIGEYFERATVFDFNDNLKSKVEIEGVNLFTKEVKNFTISDDKYKLYFSDTCGCACHTSSSNLVKNCFSEFVERQSLIFRYLTKTAICKLKFDDNLFYDLIPEDLSHLKFYNISLVSSYFVIICIGTLKNNFYIGMGADFNLINAIKNCIKEVMQISSFYKTNKSNKNYVMNSKEFKDYIDYFMSFDSKTLENAYLFLDKFEEKNVEYSLLENSFNINYTLSELYYKYKMELYLFFIKNKYNLKIAKIVDFNWFPSLLPNKISEDNIKNIENITGFKIDRKCNFIPFP